MVRAPDVPPVASRRASTIVARTHRLRATRMLVRKVMARHATAVAARGNRTAVLAAGPIAERVTADDQRLPPHQRRGSIPNFHPGDPPKRRRSCLFPGTPPTLGVHP